MHSSTALSNLADISREERRGRRPEAKTGVRASETIRQSHPSFAHVSKSETGTGAVDVNWGPPTQEVKKEVRTMSGPGHASPPSPGQVREALSPKSRPPLELDALPKSKRVSSHSVWAFVWLSDVLFCEGTTFKDYADLWNVQAGPISPILSDSEDERQLAGNTHPPATQLTSVSEAEDDSDEDEETENARTQGMQGMQKEAEIKSGYLSKKGERRKTWKRRWFVLRSKRICYYKDDKVRVGFEWHPLRGRNRHRSTSCCETSP